MVAVTICRPLPPQCVLASDNSVAVAGTLTRSGRTLTRSCQLLIALLTWPLSAVRARLGSPRLGSAQLVLACLELSCSFGFQFQFSWSATTKLHASSARCVVWLRLSVSLSLTLSVCGCECELRIHSYICYPVLCTVRAWMPNLIDIEKQLAFNSKTFIGTRKSWLSFSLFQLSFFCVSTFHCKERQFIWEGAKKSWATH